MTVCPGRLASQGLSTYQYITGIFAVQEMLTTWF